MALGSVRTRVRRRLSRGWRGRSESPALCGRASGGPRAAYAGPRPSLEALRADLPRGRALRAHVESPGESLLQGKSKLFFVAAMRTAVRVQQAMSEKSGANYQDTCTSRVGASAAESQVPYPRGQLQASWRTSAAESQAPCSPLAARGSPLPARRAQGPREPGPDHRARRERPARPGGPARREARGSAEGGRGRGRCFRRVDAFDTLLKS